MKLPYSIEIERHFLASLLKFPKSFPDFQDHFDDSLFYNGAHKIIANSIKAQFASHKTINPVLVCDYISNCGLRHKDDLDIVDYVNRIVKTNACGNESEINNYFRECFKYKVARSSILSCEETKTAILKNVKGSIKDVISAAEKGAAVTATGIIEDEFEPCDIYKDLPEVIENLAEDTEVKGIMTPFKTWNRWFGPLTKGDFTVIAAPAKAGKSTILNYIADSPFCKYNEGKNIKVLILDTELETYRVRTRKCSALANVNEFFIKNGIWQKNEELTEKVQKAFKTMKQRQGKVFHSYVAGVPVEQVCSIVRRWRALHTEPDDECLVIYDYLKITNEKITDANKEYQIMGQKCTMLKDLMSELEVAGLGAIQTNAQRDVAMSQRIKWFVSSLLLFYKKSPEQLQEHGEQFGTHILEPNVLRNLGPDWPEEEYVKEQTAHGITWTTNQLHLKVENFSLKECGTLQDLINFQKQQIDITEDGEGGEAHNKKMEAVEL